jgi:phosphate uptake regulator
MTAAQCWVRRPSAARAPRGSRVADRGTRILSFAAHYLERIGDRVTNIAEDVLFLAGGVVGDLN